MNTLRIPYPSGREIRYARWLKDFAGQLLAEGERHSLGTLPGQQAQALALDYLHVLVCQTQCATAALSQPPVEADFLSQLTACKQLIREQVAQLLGGCDLPAALPPTAGYALALHAES